ncbi:glutamate--tRNA ligase [Spirochaeta cellobiosiphila]|uniref:glutamate--tRNA ligase n=1 Tax=Spirochaeta cellobiosiphila TaxID=504483 RepID=UPI00041BC4AA|nr:glutamate--tRNA ligase [Spirochaeta cellobiosiphila]
MSVRVRYAPSPTGKQHIGGVRTALFNYFFARAQGGQFILRIEDTDQQRFSEEALQDLYDTFEWLDIHWDEGPDVGGPYGPYIQSQRSDLYKKYCDQLIEEGHAYPCFCSAERLDQVREEQKKAKSKIQGYDRHCRDLDPGEAKKRIEEGEEHVIRFKIPLEGKTHFDDLIMGTIKRKNEDISPDPVIMKSDGLPTYHLANIIDDHHMKITHVLRAQEWIPSGPLHVLLYKAFGWEAPQFCHLPMVMGKDGQKLSKRHGATSLIQFREGGYLPEAIINYVDLVGWSYDDSREFFSKEDLEQLFTIDKINKAPGVFDYKKLDWFNGQYIRKTPESEVKPLIMPYLQKAGMVSNPVTSTEDQLIDSCIPLIHERMKLLSDSVNLLKFILTDVNTWTIEDLLPKKVEVSEVITILQSAKEALAGFEKRSVEENEQVFHDLAEAKGWKLGNLMMPVRVAVTGTKQSPPLFESMMLIGSDVTMKRIDGALKFLQDNENGDN